MIRGNFQASNVGILLGYGAHGSIGAAGVSKDYRKLKAVRSSHLV